MSDLLPCPFCGHEIIEDWGDSTWSGFNKWRYCPECQAQGPHMHSRRGEGSDECQARADEAWNIRVDFAAELAETEARGYRRGIEEAEKKCAAIAGDPRMYDAERRRGAGMCQAAIRALGEKPLTPPAPAGS